MGDLRAWSPERNGVVVVLEGRLLLSPSSPSVSSSSVLFSSVNPEAEISAEYWQTAEVATQSIIARVQPTAVSEERRRAVIHYVQRLIKNSLGCEVFPFGSVPLKTYLPDGDIDLTAFGGMSLDEALANDVCSVLERAGKSGAGKFVVKDVQVIRAEVKLVKCLVQNIVVDISFNQLGGLCTLCFLEQVDRLIGKDHLFKRSITLVKAWCYYESRILGAHHGLISTYALETLVLYIFHLFHLSLNGPLAVLFKFLDYFSKFDWDNYCVSLNGPIRIGSLPEVVVEAPENSGCDLLLTNDFLNDCAQKFSVPARGFETNSRTFPPKHLNIVDPLKENNNLGRSVSKGNFYRIRSAFTYGARKLGRVLSQPEETVSAELCNFFSNTLDRHGSGQRPDVQDPLPVNEHCEFVATPLPAKESCPEDWTGLESSDSGGITADSRLDIGQSLQGGIDNVMISESKVNFHRMIKETQSTVSGPAVSENRVSGDAKDLATSRIQGPLALDKASKSDGVSSMGRPHHAPHLYLSSVDMKNGELRNGNTEWKHPESTSFSQKRISSWGPRRPGEEKVYFGSHDLHDNKVINMLEVRSPVESINHPVLFRSVSWSSDDRYAGYSGNQASGSSAGKSEALNSMSDLMGDYESHLNNLYYGRCWYECAMNGPVPSMSPPLSAQFQGKSSWDVIRQSMQYTVKGISTMNVNGVASGPVFYPMKPHLLPNGTLGMEEMAKPRGTGTYFPNMNHYKDRPTTPRGRGQTSMRSPRSNGRNMTFQETYFPERQSRDSQVQLHFHQGSGKPVSSDLRHPAFTETKPHSNVNGSEHPSEVGLEFGPAEHLTNVVPPAESDRQPNSGSASTQSSGVSLLTDEIQIPKPALGMEQDGIAEQSYRLKDDDFPPLSDSSGKGLPIYLVKKHEEQNGES